MLSRDTFASIVHCLLFFFFLIGGAFFFVASIFPTYRYHLGAFFLEKPFFSGAFSALFFSLSFLIVCLFPKKQRMRYQMAPHSVDIDRKVIHSYIQEFWEEEFPSEVKHFDLFILPDNTLEIAVELNSFDLETKKRFLEKSEYGLGKILSGFLDYHQKFFITMHFS